ERRDHLLGDALGVAVDDHRHALVARRCAAVLGKGALTHRSFGDKGHPAPCVMQIVSAARSVLITYAKSPGELARVPASSGADYDPWQKRPQKCAQSPGGAAAAPRAAAPRPLRPQ